MKKLFKPFSAMLLLTTLISCSTEIYQATRQTSPIVADGNPAEWSLPLRFGDQKTGLQYNFTNDESNLYICIRATEQNTQKSILGSGMEIQLEPGGKNKQISEIRFPLPAKQNEYRIPENAHQGMAAGNKQGGMDFTKHYLNQDHQITFNGFQPEYNGTFKLSELKGFKAGLNWDEQNSMTYELTIPLNALYANDSKYINDNPVVGIKIQINSMAMGYTSGSPRGRTENKQGSSSGQNQGKKGSGMGGGMAGGGRGGSHGGAMPDNSGTHKNMGLVSMNKPVFFKFKIKLTS